MMLQFASCLWLLLVAGAAVPDALSWIRSSSVLGDLNFYDEHGRVRIFHGSNRVHKSPPWYVDEMYRGDAEADYMQSVGFTVARLGFMWSGYNPAPGIFNQTYIDVIKAIVGRLAQRGVYSLLNVQMDGLSSKFGTYDGAPLWVINKSISKHAFPWPRHSNQSRGGWDINIMTEASATAYQDIFDNNHGMLDDFVAFWSHAAKQFKDVSGVIGYDIMNEPFAGNFYEDPTLLLPGIAGRNNLQRMYDIVATAIRKYDDRHIIFYEPVTWGMVFKQPVVGSGFEHVPGGDVYRNRSAYSYHYYCHDFVSDGHPRLQKVVCDKTIGPRVWRTVREDLNRIGGAQMMTEGMQCDGVQHECEYVMNELDTHLFSWMDWTFGMYNIPKSESWARTYAHAVAGVPLNMSFNPKTKDFNFCFQMNSAIQAPTEIFASTKYSYPHGFSVSTSGNVKVSIGGDLVFVTPSCHGDNGSEACVQIIRKAKIFQHETNFAEYV